MKLKTTINHTFNIEEDIMQDIDFNFTLKEPNIKKKPVIIIEKSKSHKLKNDSSTRLF